MAPNKLGGAGYLDLKPQPQDYGLERVRRNGGVRSLTEAAPLIVDAVGTFRANCLAFETHSLNAATARIVREHRHTTTCRRSIIQSDMYRKVSTINGQDLGALYLDVLELPANRHNYMAYRTVKEFPVVAETINKAVEQVVTGQRSARDAMDAAQEDLYRPANSL